MEEDQEQDQAAEAGGGGGGWHADGVDGLGGPLTDAEALAAALRATADTGVWLRVSGGGRQAAGGGARERGGIPKVREQKCLFNYILTGRLVVVPAGLRRARAGGCARLLHGVCGNGRGCCRRCRWCYRCALCFVRWRRLTLSWLYVGGGVVTCAQLLHFLLAEARFGYRRLAV